MSQSIDLHEALSLAETLARDSGRLLREMFHGALNIKFKTSGGIVTQADRKSEKLITKAILKRYPDHHMVGEEGGGMGAPRESAPYRWYIDPLDGTTNFAHGIPHFCVSIALAGPDDRPLVGVVYDPNVDECFKALRGEGATLNDQPIRVSTVNRLDRAVLQSGFPYDRRTNPDNNSEEWSVMLRRAGVLRCLGASAVDLCYVAAGRIDGFWEPRLHAWDFMAALLCISEAGGRLSNYRGQLNDQVYTGEEIVATNGLIHEDVLAVLVLGNSAPQAKPKRKIGNTGKTGNTTKVKQTL